MGDAAVMRYMVLHELRLCGKYKSEVSQVLKESSASSALKTEKKTLNATSLKILMFTYGSYLYYFSACACA